MKLKISDLLLVSDVDGTLVHAPQPIPVRNIEAVKRYVEAGGRFALATGRSIKSAREYVNQLPVHAPCIIFNGGALYDFEKEQLLYACYLPETYKAYIRAVTDRFPEVGVTLFNTQKVYSVSNPLYNRKYMGMERIDWEECGLDGLQGDFFKCIFCVDSEQMPAIIAFIQEQGWRDVDFVRSDAFFYEMLPSGVSKGTCLEKLAEIAGVSREHTAAIGDFDNDLLMLRYAGLAATVPQADALLQQEADFITGACAQGAVADFISYLEERAQN